MTNVTELPERGVIAVGGEDRVSFLQGLVSNDVADAAPGRAVWAAFLTPQGKWLADFFIHADGDLRPLHIQQKPIAVGMDEKIGQPFALGSQKRRPHSTARRGVRHVVGYQAL